MYKSNAKVLNVGDVLPSKLTGDFKIVAIRSATQVDVSFINNPEPIQTITATRARIGNVSDPLYPTVENRGYLGIGQHECYVKGKRNKIYLVWRGMLVRAYGDGNSATSVCKEWWNFQTFADWYIETLGDIEEDMTVVFDVLDPSNKIYGPEHTTMVPTYIQKILINNTSPNKATGLPRGVSEGRDKQGRLNGTYKAYIQMYGKKVYLGGFHSVLAAAKSYNAAKTQHVRDSAKQYKHLLTEEAFRALLKWQATIDK